MGNPQPSFAAHPIEEHLLRARGIDQVFRIKVWQPLSRTDGSERFPVLYATDSDEHFAGLVDMARGLQNLGEVERFILVGIGYENSAAAGLLRMRDLHTHSIRALFAREMKQLAESPLAGAGADLAAITETTDASDFLGFIREELMPWVDRRYPSDPANTSYWGFSAGGGFGLYALFTQPETFGRYILGSPATSYDGQNFGVEHVRRWMQAHRSLQARVFMCVGELEDLKKGFGPFDLLSGYTVLTKFLHTAALPGLELTHRVFPDETHATAWPLSFTHGLRKLFAPTSPPPFLPDYLK